MHLAASSSMVNVSESAVNRPTLIPQGGFEHFPPVRLRRGISLVGNSDGVHVRLRSHTISRLHALFLNADARLLIRDLASRRHIYVNGRLVREAVLASGDEVRIGRIRFRVVLPDAFGASGVITSGTAQLHCRDDKCIPISSGLLTIGSRRDMDVVLSAPHVSVAHALVFAAHGAWFLMDLKTDGGTRLNNKPIGEAEVKHGDIIEIGGSAFRFELSVAGSQGDRAIPAAPDTADSPGDDRGAGDLLSNVEHAMLPPKAPPLVTHQSAIAGGASEDLLVQPTELDASDSRDGESSEDIGAESSPEPLVEASASARAELLVSSEVTPAASSDPECCDGALEISPTPDTVQPAAVDEEVTSLPPAHEQDSIPRSSRDVECANAQEELSGPQPALGSAPTSDDDAEAETHLAPPTIRGWGPLAVALAAQSQPGLLAPAKSAESAQQPFQPRRAWTWTVITALIVLGALGIAAWVWTGSR